MPYWEIFHAAARQEGRCNKLPTWEAAASIPQEIYPFFSAAIELNRTALLNRSFKIKNDLIQEAAAEEIIGGAPNPVRPPQCRGRPQREGLIQAHQGVPHRSPPDQLNSFSFQLSSFSFFFPWCRSRRA